MVDEADIIYARGGFPDVQAELAIYPARLVDGVFTCGWYGTAISPERGSFCIVNVDGPLADRVGDYLRVSYLTKSVTVYCLEAFSIPYDLAVTRRAFYEIAELWNPYLDVRVSDILDGYDGAS